MKIYELFWKSQKSSLIFLSRLQMSLINLIFSYCHTFFKNPYKNCKIYLWFLIYVFRKKFKLIKKLKKYVKNFKFSRIFCDIAIFFKKLLNLCFDFSFLMIILLFLQIEKFILRINIEIYIIFRGFWKIL